MGGATGAAAGAVTWGGAKALGLLNGYVCFAAGTPVLVATARDGELRYEGRPIEQVRADDLVLSRSEFDPEGPVVAKRVEEVFVRRGEVLELRAGGRIIRTTAEHPFWVRGRGWTAAGELEAGDLLAGHDGEWTAVEAAAATGKTETVYNFRVADHHTYFVGCDEWGFSVWAHNAECANPQAIADVAGVKRTIKDRAARIMRQKGEEAALEYLARQKDIHGRTVGEPLAKKAIEQSKIKLPDPITDKTYQRPGGTDWRKGEREAVWKAAVEASPDGVVRDPVTGRAMNFDEPWHMGHKRRYEFWKHQQSAKQRGLTREQFLEEYHNKEHFRPELPNSNVGRAGEDKTLAYLGP